MNLPFFMLSVHIPSFLLGYNSLIVVMFSLSSPLLTDGQHRVIEFVQGVYNNVVIIQTKVSDQTNNTKKNDMQYISIPYITVYDAER